MAVFELWEKICRGYIRPRSIGGYIAECLLSAHFREGLRIFDYHLTGLLCGINKVIPGSLAPIRAVGYLD